MKILIVTTSISRKAGGLYTALSGLGRELHSHCSVTVFSLRDEFSDDDRKAWFPSKPILFARSGLKQMGYSLQLAKHISRVIVDIIHSHGVWMYPSIKAGMIATTRKIPFIISPHGMLDSWALKNSAWKKKVAGWFYGNRNLHSATCIHALCKSEYQSIRAYNLKNPVCIIPNGVDLPDLRAVRKPPPWDLRTDANKNVVLFLGRIHPKKGLENLIRAWSILKAQKNMEIKHWHLVIAGWSQHGYEEKIKRLADELNLGSDITFTGPLYDTDKDAALRAAKAFILPSFSEGLPMAVLEAWSYGLPVIMTRQCNIPGGFDNEAALDVRPDVESITEGLRDFFCLSENKREDMGRNGLELVKSRYSWSKVAAEMLGVYQWILGRSSKPECVRLE